MASSWSAKPLEYKVLRKNRRRHITNWFIGCSLGFFLFSEGKMSLLLERNCSIFYGESSILSHGTAVWFQMLLFPFNMQSEDNKNREKMKIPNNTYTGNYNMCVLQWNHSWMDDWIDQWHRRFHLLNVVRVSTLNAAWCWKCRCYTCKDNNKVMMQCCKNALHSNVLLPGGLRIDCRPVEEEVISW